MAAKVSAGASRNGLRQRWLMLAMALLSTTSVMAARQFGTSDGLLQDSADSIVRDELGFLWLAAESGLIRFDGRHFVPPPPAIASKLQGDAITALASDGHILWVGTRSSGLRRIDLRKETVDRLAPSADGLPEATIRTIVVDARRDLWLGTDGAGVVRVRWDSGVPVYKQYLPGAGGLPHERVWTVSLDGSTVLVGTQEGAARLIPGSDRFEAMIIPAPFPAAGKANIEEIAADGHGGYWVGTWDDGLFRISGGKVRKIPLLAGVDSQRISSLAIVDGNPVIGSDVGVARYQAECDCLHPIPLLSSREGLSQRAFVHSVIALDDGGILVGTRANGAFHVPANASVFQRIQPLRVEPAETISDRVQAMLEDSSGVLWLGSFGAGLQRSLRPIGAGRVELETVSIDSNARNGALVIWALREDSQGRIWVGSDAGLDRLDPAAGSWTNFPVRGDGHGLPGPGVRDLLELPSGEMLVATSSGLAAIAPDDSVRAIAYASPGPSQALAHTLNAMFRDERGRLWLATYDGVRVLDQNFQSLRVFHESETTPGLARDLHPGPDGKLLIASTQLCRVDSSLQQLDDAVLDCFGSASGIPQDGIQAVETGSDGAVWVSSMHGLRRLMPGSGDVQSFYSADGLIADEFGQRASHAGRSGRLYFGTTYGLQVFDPRAAVAPRGRLRPLVTEVRVGGIALRAGKSRGGAQLDAATPYAHRLLLRPGTRQFMLGFSLLGANRSSQRVEFRIDGLQDWLPAADTGMGNFISLPAGTFDIHLRANEDNVRHSGERLALSVEVMPFWWERRSVQIGGALLILLSAWLLYQNRIRSLRNRERWLSNEVKARTREIEQQKSELAIANQQLYELSIRDSLTGIYNRRHLLEETRRILRQADQTDICIALIDLDHFKAINDRFGHIAGDEVLRYFAAWLRAQAGPGDVLGRYGGEEFVCLLYDRNIDQARRWGDSLLKRVRESEIAGPNCEIRVTASIGLVAIDQLAALPLEVWIARADAALYRAKESGRDRVLIG